MRSGLLDRRAESRVPEHSSQLFRRAMRVPRWGTNSLRARSDILHTDTRTLRYRLQIPLAL